MHNNQFFSNHSNNIQSHTDNVQRLPEKHIDHSHSIEEEMATIVHGIIRRTRLSWLEEHYAKTPVLAFFSFINGCISIALLSIVALVARSPFIFPSLGPTAFLFFYTPTQASASPRNTIIGHTIGIFTGYLSLVVTGLTAAGPALVVGVSWPRVIAAALSLGLCSGLMVLLKSPHPPAGATTLIISLGILTKPLQLGILMIAVIILTLLAIVLNRFAGIPYPLWSPKKETKEQARKEASPEKI